MLIFLPIIWTNTSLYKLGLHPPPPQIFGGNEAYYAILAPCFLQSITNVFFSKEKKILNSDVVDETFFAFVCLSAPESS
jgi:hypothetical protein